MSYPSILQYIESLSNPSQLLKTLKNIKLELNNNEEPIYSSGNFGVVFKVSDGDSVKALKCFTRDQHGRGVAYHALSKYFVDLPLHMLSFDYLEDEISVFHDDGTLLRYPLLLMDWAEGNTLEFELHRAAILNDHDRLSVLSRIFEKFAVWLLSKDFAHGDLKPENLIIGPNDELIMVDYDGIFLPSMEGEFQREVGTAGFQHPLRSAMKMCKSIDDYSIAILVTMLRVVAQEPASYFRYGQGGSAMFDPVLIMKGKDLCFNSLKNSKLEKCEIAQCLLSNTPQISNLSKIITDLEVVQDFALDADNESVAQEYCDSNSILRRFKLNNKFGFVGLDGNVVIDAKYDQVRQFVGGFAAVCISRRWGVIDVEGKIIAPTIYNTVRDFSDGYFAVEFYGKWGCISPHGKSVIPIKWDNIWSFSCGRALVKRGDKYGFLNIKGKVVVACQFDYAQSFVEDVACVELDGKYGFIDVKGDWVVEPQYAFASSVRNGTARVLLSVGGDEVEVRVKKMSIKEDV